MLVSVQQSVDCSNGGSYTNGGDPDTVGTYYGTNGICTELANPVLGTAGVCPSNCGGGITYQGAGFRDVYALIGPYMSSAVQRELVLYGALTVTIEVYNDLFAYGGGIYTGAANGSTVVGGHSAVLIGWGSEGGVPYWTVQNSWGAGWGENGCIRILRGADIMSIESSSMQSILVAPTTQCPNSPCNNGSTVMADCSCNCANSLLSGPTCSVCATCQNGGVMNAQCTACACPPGFVGPLCQYGVWLSRDAHIAGDASKITVTWKYNSSAGFFPPKVRARVKPLLGWRSDACSLQGQSIVGIYAQGVVNPYSTSYSTKFCSSTTGAYCAAAGSFLLAAPSTPGVYNVYLAPYQYLTPPYNGIYNLDTSYNTDLGNYPVVANTSDAVTVTLPAAKASSGRMITLANTLAIQAAKDAAVAAAAAARLPLRAGVANALLAVPPHSLTVTNLNPDGTIFRSGQTQVCWYLPPYLNTPVRAIGAWTANLAGTYPTLLKAESTQNIDNPSATGCVIVRVFANIGTTLRLAIGTPDGFSRILAATIPLKMNRVILGYYKFVNASSTTFTLQISWQYMAGGMQRNDSLRLYNPNGAPVDWFYTSGTKNLPAKPGTATTGTVSFTLSKRGPQGPYPVYFYYNASDFYSSTVETAAAWDWYNAGWLAPTSTAAPTTRKTTTPKPTTPQITSAAATLRATSTTVPTSVPPSTSTPTPTTTTVPPSTSTPIPTTTPELADTTTPTPTVPPSTSTPIPTTTPELVDTATTPSA